MYRTCKPCLFHTIMKTFTLMHLEKSLVRLTGANVAAVFLANRIFHTKWIFCYSESELSHVVTQWAGLISILPFAAVGRGLPLPTRVHWPPSETCLGHLSTSIQSQPLLTKMTPANRNSTANTIQQAVAGKIHEAPKVILVRNICCYKIIRFQQRKANVSKMFC